MLNQPTEPRRSWLAALLRRPLVVNVDAKLARPGDVLVVTLPAGLSRKTVDEIKEHLGGHLVEAGVRPFVLSDGIRAEVVSGARE